MAIMTTHAAIPAYITKDGSEIRELLHPSAHGNANQSLAEATVPPGGRTLRHCHRMTEELYHVLSGRARMTLGDEQFEIRPGDTVCIPPGTPHALEVLGAEPLRILCCCSPAYSHADTELIEVGP